MRWITKKSLPLGTRKTVRRFAWFPARCEGGVTVWLDWVSEELQWTSYDGEYWTLIARHQVNR